MSGIRSQLCLACAGSRKEPIFTDQVLTRSLKWSLFAAALVAWNVTCVVSAQTFLYFTSSPGSWVGQGQTLTLSPTNSFGILVLSETGFVNVLIEGATWGNLRLGTADGSAFTPGLYQNAQN